VSTTGSDTPSLRGERVAGAILWRGGSAAALAVAAVALAASVLVPFGLWMPVVALPVLLVLGAIGWRLLRLVPVRPAPVWTAGLTVALSAGFGIWAALTRAEQVVLRRDSGSYALYSHWIATRHGLPVDPQLDAFGGAATALGIPQVTLGSPGFFESSGFDLLGHGGSVVLPQFLVGAPALYSLGWWAAGWTGLFVVPAVLGALALLAFGGLTVRLVGARWAPLAVAALGLTQPVLHAARATWSEAPALLLLVAALALAADAVARDDVRVARLAGLLAGLAGLVRIDSLREVALLVAVCALLVLRGSRVAVPMAVTALAASVLAAVPAVAYSMPYLSINASSLLPLVAATAVLAVLLAAAVLVAPGRGSPAPASAAAASVAAASEARVQVLTPAGAVPARRIAAGTPGTAGLPRPTQGGPPRAGSESGPLLEGEAGPAWRRPLPLALGALVAGTGIVLASRPWWLVARQALPAPVARGLSNLQQQQGLAVDGTRTYAEQSVRWVAWYTGPVAPVLALGTLTVLGVLAGVWWQRSRRDGSPPPAWLLPAAVGFASTVLVLYRPGITPDHPWADRRLVTSVLPTVALAAVAAIAWATRTLRARVPAPVFPVAGVLGAVALLWPAWSATGPVAALATERGEAAAAAGVCASLEPQDVVVAVSGGDRDGGQDRGTNEWPQVIRGVCGHPMLSVLTPTRDPQVQRAALERLDALASAAGRRLLVLSATDGDGTPPQHLLDLGLRPRSVVRLETTEDRHVLERPATGTSYLLVEVWTAPWSSRAGG
jgi:hypothetical protein